MLTEPKLKYRANSHKPFGDNGNCFYSNITSPDCDGGRDQILRDKLYNRRDPLPIVIDLETSEEIVPDVDSFFLENPLLLEATGVTSNLKFQRNSNVSQKVSFEVCNVLGQKLLEHRLAPLLNSIVDVSTRADGLYYLKTSLPHSPIFKFRKTP